MTAMRLSEAAAALGGQLYGEDAEFNAVSTDSRAVRAGELFVALAGERFDAHDFVSQAQANGAVAALVSRHCGDGLPLLLVEDTRRALGRLAQTWRLRHAVTTLAVTGSNGKTTVKEMIAAALSQSGAVLATRGNLNNEIGVPLTLLRLRTEHRFAVVEMGANHAGEIAYLTGLAHPQVAVVTNAGPAHLEGFGSIEGVAHAKGEIFSGLEASGTAVINADDAFAEVWYRLARHTQVVRFGLSTEADVTADWQPHARGSRVIMHTPVGSAELILPLPGRHNVVNALAATAAALAVGVPLETICRGLETLQPVAGRLQMRAGIGELQILDDTYNANPGSLGPALAVLAGQSGHKWLVLGDMLELGGEGEALHRQAGRLARGAGVDGLYALGTLARFATLEFGDGARHFDNWQDLVDALRRDCPGAGTVLVKGSRGMHLERVVDALLVEPQRTAGGNGGR